jgi:outer membrane lipoprotein-sorting protein
MKRISALVCALFILASMAGAQEIVTAEQFFAKVSDRYAQVEDYEAAIVVTSTGQPMTGKLYFKSPTLLRIDFVQPP